MSLNISPRMYGDKPSGIFQLTATVAAPLRARNIGIEVESGKEPYVNVCASGAVTPEGARELAKALLVAADLAEGKVTFEL